MYILISIETLKQADNKYLKNYLPYKNVDLRVFQIVLHEEI